MYVWRWAGRLRTNWDISAYKILVRKRQGKGPPERLLQGAMGYWDVFYEIACKDAAWIHIPQDRVQWRPLLIQHNNKPTGYVKSGVFLYYLSYYQHVKKDCVPWSLDNVSSNKDRSSVQLNCYVVSSCAGVRLVSKARLRHSNCFPICC